MKLKTNVEKGLAVDHEIPSHAEDFRLSQEYVSELKVDKLMLVSPMRSHKIPKIASSHLNLKTPFLAGPMNAIGKSPVSLSIARNGLALVKTLFMMRCRLETESVASKIFCRALQLNGFFDAIKQIYLFI